MDLSLRTALVTYVIATYGGDLDGAWAAVDDLAERAGAPTTEGELRTFLRELEPATI
jgi:hypothetical protein